jgi:hypothetical protein
LKARIFVPSGAAARMAMALAVSIGLPPPKPTRQSKSPRLSTATPASITVSVGSGTVSLKTSALRPAALSGAKQRSTVPDDTIQGSVTTSGRDRPNWASTSARPGHAAAADPHDPRRDDRCDHGPALPLLSGG